MDRVSETSLLLLIVNKSMAEFKGEVSSEKTLTVLILDRLGNENGRNELAQE